MEKNMNSTERAVTSLKQIYAVIIGVAIGYAISEMFPENATFIWNADFIKNLPVLISFFAFIIPFYHGMDRHLDRCYIERYDTNKRGFLLFDFFIFCFESVLFIIFALLITKNLKGYEVIALMLLVDMIWGFISHWIHYRDYSPSIINWAIINLVVLCMGFIFYNIEIISIPVKSIIFLVISLMRTIADYTICWKFYFPKEN